MVFPALALDRLLEDQHKAGEGVGFRITKAEVNHFIRAKITQVETVVEFVLQVIEQHLITHQQRFNGLIGQGQTKAARSDQHKEILIRQTRGFIEVIDEIFELG